MNKQSAALKNNLELIKRKANDLFDQFKFSGIDFTLELVDKLRGKEERPVLLIDYVEEEKKRIEKDWVLILHRQPVINTNAALSMFSNSF